MSQRVLCHRWDIRRNGAVDARMKPDAFITRISGLRFALLKPTSALIMSESASSASAPSLAPPLRPRASSTNIRPGLTVDTLGSRRGISFVCPGTPDQAHPPRPLLVPSPATEELEHSQDSLENTKAQTMLAAFLARCLQVLHMSSKHAPWSGPASPSKPNTDEFLLPVIDTPRTPTFGDVLNEKPPTRAPRSWWHGAPSVHAPILFVIMLFPATTALVFFALATLPITVSWPHNITDLAEMGRQLHAYSTSGSGPMAHVIGVLSLTAVWKHAWSVPGSVIWNVLAGALFSPAYATLLMTILTALGSICATLLAAPLAPFLTYAMPRALDMTRHALEGSSSSDTTATASAKPSSPAWVRLSILRLIGVVPWSGINIACGVCGVAILDCFLGSFIGSLPWTAVTCQIGDILQTVASTPSPTPQTVSSLLTSPWIIFKLVLLSFLSLAPIVGRDKLRQLMTPSDAGAVALGLDGEEDGQERKSRWSWSRVRFPSRSHSREQQASAEKLISP